MTTAEDWLRLAFVGMHPERLRVLIRDVGSPSEVLGAIAAGRVDVPPAAREAALVPAETRHRQLEASSVSFLLPGTEQYPDLLRALPDRPLFLFHRGAPIVGRGVAIVGTRACTAYGRRLAEAYGRAVSESGWAVVSGLARGIDGAAHRGSLSGPTPGVVVLGSGIDVWYPREHEWLGEQLLEAGGAILSEAPPGTRPVGWRFPPRNRIISGLAGVVVVVEAGERGGALITARTAAEQGRDVFVTPGDIDRPASVGSNRLIRDGAHPVFDALDLVSEVELVLGPAPIQRALDVIPTVDDDDADLAAVGREEVDRAAAT